MKTINSFRSKLLALTLALMASVSTFAYDYHGDLLCYNILTDSTVAVTGQSEYKTMPRYEYLPENLVIPSEVTLQGKAYKVVSIDQWAFYACTMLKSVTIPSSVTFIGLSAFQYCENLVNVDIPTSVTTVEGSAFSYTKWYDNLPDGEVYINNTLYRYKGTAPENTQIVVKDGTTRIAGFTFWNQSNIVAIELPQTLTDIEHGAFEGCTQLSSILIPKNVIFIDCSAFAQCTGLMEVICLAPTPPIAGVSANPSPSDWMFAGVDVANVLLYVPMESIELYRNADQWKDFQIRVYYGSEECHEYMHVNLTALPLITGKLTYRLSTDDGSEIPDVDSVWILNTDKEPLRKFYAQSGDTIDLLFLERGPYILNVYLNECIKSRTFVHRPKWKYTWCDTWNVMWFDGMRFDETASTSQYRLGKDTVIGDYRYSKFTSRTSVRFTDDKKVYVYYEGFDDNDPYTEDLPTGEYLAYDFSAQVGDTLEVFSGSHSYTTEQCVVYDVQTDPETNLRTIMLHPLRVVDGDGNVGVSEEEITWLEGVGSPNGFLISTPPPGGGLFALLCAYRGDELRYTGDFYDEYGCEYNAGPFNEKLLGTWRVVGGNEIISIFDSIIVFKYLGLTQKYTASATQLTVERLWIPEEESFRWANCDYTLSNDTLWIDNFTPLLVATYPPKFGPITLVKVKNEDLFPTLWGLQQTICSGYYGEEGDEWASGLTGPSQEITMMDGKPYLQWGSWYLREENDKILVYSEIQKKDLVLYDFTLELGDTLTTLNLVTPEFLEYEGIVGIVDYPLSDYDYTYPIDTLVVTELSKETLLDGKEYTRWKFSDGTVYVEGIGSMSETFFHHIADHLPVPVSYLGSYLVCVSKNNKLLYQMDEAEMERLGTECLCAQPGKGETDDAKDGQIGGRPTPTQWYIVEINQEVIHKLPAQRSDENNSSILSAETYIYTLENDSLRVNGKKYFELDRYSSKNSPDTKVNVGALHFGQDDKVWFYHANTEYLLYDFSAEVGDTLQLFAGIHNYPTDSVYTHVVTAKDTIEDGITRVTLDAILYEQVNGQQTELHYEKVWLAGLGSIDGIVHNSAKLASKARNNIEQNHVMLCAWREDECLYTTDHPDFMDVGCEYNHDFTAVEDIHTSGTQYQKIIRDGHLYILRDNRLYNVLGTPMN